MQCFCDSDGVCAAFDEHVVNLFGKTVREIGNDDLMWEMIKEAADEFWPTMPLKYGARDLWRTIEAFKPIVLTGCPKSHYDIAAAHKVEWYRKNFGDHVEVITCLSRNKPLHMKAPGDILIDDFSRNIKRWKQAGGIGVHYRTVEQAKADFNKAVLKIGDVIQVQIAGAFVLPIPKPITDIKEHEGKHWVFIEGSQTGVRIHDAVFMGE